MREFDKSEFTIAPFTGLLGEAYGNYWTQAIRHKSGNLIDVLLNEAGDLVTEPDDITDLIRKNFYLDGEHAKVIPIKISGQKCLIIKFPTIKTVKQ